MLGVEGGAHARGDQAELVLGGVQGAGAHTQQATQLAATEQAFGNGDGRAALGNDVDVEAGRVGRRGLGRQLGGVGADHQGLTGADEHRQGTVAGLGGGHASELVELLDEAITGVEQVVGRLGRPGLLGHRDLVVHFGDLGGVGADGTDRVLDLALEAGAHVVEALGEILETGHEALGRGDHRLPGRDAGGVGRHFLHAFEEGGHRRGQAHGGIGQQVVDLADLGAVGVVLVELGLGGQHLIVQEAIVGALDGINLGPLAEEARPGKQGRVGALHGALTAVARRAGVGDVVAGHHQARLGGVEAGETDAEEAAAHDPLPWFGGVRGRQCKNSASSSGWPENPQALRVALAASAVRRVLPLMMRASLSAYCGSVA